MGLSAIKMYFEVIDFVGLSGFRFTTGALETGFRRVRGSSGQNS
jgi:hypothetical protein